MTLKPSTESEQTFVIHLLEEIFKQSRNNNIINNNINTNIHYNN